MAKLNNDFLMNLIKNTPEVQAGYMPVDTSGIRGLYQQPRGPLYNVDVEMSDLESPLSKFKVYDPDRQEHLETYGKRGGIKKASEKQLLPGLTTDMFTNMRPAINTFKREGVNENKVGYTRENKLNTEIGLTSPINISDHYERLVGTNPTSPRNSEMIYTGTGVDEIPNLTVNNASDDLMRAFDYEYPETINRDAVNTVRHEIAHNVNELPNYVDSTNFARNINMNELFGIPNAIGSNPLGYYDKDDMTAHAKEELFNRAKDTYFQKNDGYYPPNHRFRTLLDSQKYINNNLKKYSNSSNRFDPLNTYSNYIRPKVLQHFDQMKTDALNRPDNNTITNNVTSTGGGNGGGHVQTPGTYDTDISTGGSGDHRTMANGGRINFKNGGLASIL